MVPLRDDNPVQIRPYVTYALIAINIAVFLYEITLPPPALQDFFQSWAVVPADLTTSFTRFELQEWITLITAQFLHGGLLHLGGNMLYLWIFGNNIEERLGRIPFLVFYLACGVLASLAQWAVAPDSTVPSLGASGAIAGLMGAYILRYPRAKILTLVPLGFIWTTFRIPAVFFLGFWFVQQALYGIADLDAATNVGMRGGVAYWAHAGGFLIGVVLLPIFEIFRSSSPKS